ncbi:MAG TPA: DUF2339 domain-containing protein [Burkholderiales bacterium]|nr:DUF2339 domain-containing protein [Burkholderiales bacterium]
MPVILGLVGVFWGAVLFNFWAAALLGAAGVWLGIWINRNDAERKRRREAATSSGTAISAPALAAGGEPQLEDFASLREEVLALRRRVEQLEAGGAIERPAPASPRPQPAATSPAQAVEWGTPPRVETWTEPSPKPSSALFATAPAAKPAAESAAAAPAPAAPVQPSRLWNLLFGGNAMVRVGVVVLFFGVAFLMKYAAEHVHVPIELRLAGVALGAVVMLVVGWRLRARAGGYGLVLQGGGVGVLYLVVFGAFRLWQLLPPELAFALLVAIAFSSAMLAVLQDSRALAIAGVSGGFLAPLLASTGQGSHVMLFGFYVVLNLGVVAIAWYKAWRPLNLVGFAFTFVIGAVWGTSYYRPEHYATTQPFLIVFFLLYVAIAVLFALRRAEGRLDYVDSALVFGVPLVAAGLQFGLIREIEYGAAWSALATGAFYVLLARRLWALHREALQFLAECFVALGIGFATLAIPLAFDGRWTAASWALEGAAALWVGTRQNRQLPRAFGLLLQPAAGLAFLWGARVAPGALAVLNSHFMGGITIALAGLFSAWTLRRGRHDARDWEPGVAGLLLAWGVGWWIGTGWNEISRFAPERDMVHALQLAFAAASALLFLAAQRKLQWAEMSFAANALLPAMVGFAVLWAAHSHPFAAYGYAAWPAGFLVLYWVILRVEPDVPPGLAQANHCAALWLLVALGGWECAWQLDALVGEGRIWSQIGRPLVPAILAAWIVARAGRGGWPLGTHGRLYLAQALAPVMVALWLWVLYINFASNGDPAPLPYLPLLNPLDLAVALIAVVYAIWRRALERAGMPEPLWNVLRVAPGWIGATAFVWANGILLRSLHHWADVPFRLSAMLRSTLVQASFSVFWTVLAMGAMVFANRRRVRSLWICGAALLGVVVVKLFIFDLERISGVERIVSFIAVGILLLVIGYIAPVPPRTEEKSP